MEFLSKLIQIVVLRRREGEFFRPIVLLGKIMSHSIHSFSRSSVHCNQKLNRYLVVIIRVVVLLHSSKPGQGCQLPMFDVVHKITMERVVANWYSRTRKNPIRRRS